MIERNIGNLERLLRLAMGILMGAWALQQGTLNPVEWFVVVISIALICNGIFSRCYLWYLLEVNTHANGDKGCAPDYTCP